MQDGFSKYAAKAYPFRCISLALPSHLLQRELDTLFLFLYFTNFFLATQLNIKVSMKNIFIFLLLMKFFVCSAQTFTLSELENYAKYDFETLSHKLMARGYEFYKSDNQAISFIYPTNSAKSIYMIIYGNERLLYMTTIKTNYMNLTKEIKSKGYKYITSFTRGKDTICNKYQNDSNIIEACMGSQETDDYELPKNFYSISLNLIY